MELGDWRLSVARYWQPTRCGRCGRNSRQPADNDLAETAGKTCWLLNKQHLLAYMLRLPTLSAWLLGLLTPTRQRVNHININVCTAPLNHARINTKRRMRRRRNRISNGQQRFKLPSLPTHKRQSRRRQSTCCGLPLALTVELGNLCKLKVVTQLVKVHLLHSTGTQGGTSPRPQAGLSYLLIWALTNLSYVFMPK